MAEVDWPEGFRRTDPDDREPMRKYQATLGQTTKELADEMDRLDPEHWRASTGSGGSYTKKNGLPKARANPDDPGFVLRWVDDGDQFAVACDSSPSLRDNARTVYLWIRETRMRNDRPVETGESNFAAARLPPGDDEADDEDVVVAGAAPDEDPHEVLEVSPDASRAAIVGAYRQKMKTAHPDNGGSSAEVRRLQRAKEAMLDD